MVFELAWGKNGTPNTLLSSADDLDITDLTATKFNVFLHYIIPTGTSTDNKLFVDQDTGVTYARRASTNGAADATGVSKVDIPISTNITVPDFDVYYVMNISGEEKLFMRWQVSQNTAGAANAPSRVEMVFKYTGTTQFTRIDLENADAGGSFDTDSNFSALGTD